MLDAAAAADADAWHSVCSPLKLGFKGNTMALQTVTVHVNVLTQGGSKMDIPGIHRGSDVWSEDPEGQSNKL